jgi:hypothetical protein
LWESSLWNGAGAAGLDLFKDCVSTRFGERFQVIRTKCNDGEKSRGWGRERERKQQNSNLRKFFSSARVAGFQGFFTQSRSRPRENGEERLSSMILQNYFTKTE